MTLIWLIDPMFLPLRIAVINSFLSSVTMCYKILFSVWSIVKGKCCIDFESQVRTICMEPIFQTSESFSLHLINEQLLSDPFLVVLQVHVSNVFMKQFFQSIISQVSETSRAFFIVNVKITISILYIYLHYKFHR